MIVKVLILLLYVDSLSYTLYESHHIYNLDSLICGRSFPFLLIRSHFGFVIFGVEVDFYSVTTLIFL